MGDGRSQTIEKGSKCKRWGERYREGDCEWTCKLEQTRGVGEQQELKQLISMRDK